LVQLLALLLLRNQFLVALADLPAKEASSVLESDWPQIVCVEGLPLLGLTVDLVFDMEEVLKGMEES
jgi:hypothetical protein